MKISKDIYRMRDMVSYLYVRNRDNPWSIYLKGVLDCFEWILRDEDE